MRAYFLITGFILVTSHLFSAEIDYRVSNIPGELSKGAVAVVRLDENILTVADNGSTVLSCRYAITVLNDNGIEYGYFRGGYNNFIKYRKLSANLYDQNGKQIKKVKSSEIYDVSSIASYSLFEDHRMKIISPRSNSYPYTVEYSYEINLKSVLSYPTWDLIPGFDVAVQRATYQIIMPAGKEFRYFANKLDKEPVIESTGGREVYFWEIDNLPLIKMEPYTTNDAEYFPALYLHPVELNYGGVTASIHTWEDVGNWILKMNNGKQILSPESEMEIMEVIKGCTSDEEIVKTLYNYMQDKVRYVNISIGLGGLEPISAQRVHDVNYGDCKALTNYMYTLLDVAGIRSVYTLVNAGENAEKVYTDFPSQQFNHVILMVPMEQDSIWLECTSQRLPAGYLGTFTDDRTVLFVTEDGGKLGRSPAFSLEENRIETVARITVDDQLNAMISRDKKYLGNYFNDKYSQILNLDAIEQKRSIQRNLELSGFSILAFDHTYSTDFPVYINEHTDIEVDRITSSSGEYVLLPMNLVNSKVGVATRVRNRKQELYIRRDNLSIDSVFIELPDNLEVYRLPDSIQIESDFGRYVSSVSQHNNNLLFTRRLEYYKGLFPSDRYHDFYSYTREISKADGQQVMLKFR